MVLYLGCDTFRVHVFKEAKEKAINLLSQIKHLDTYHVWLMISLCIPSRLLHLLRYIPTNLIQIELEQFDNAILQVLLKSLILSYETTEEGEDPINKLGSCIEIADAKILINRSRKGQKGMGITSLAHIAPIAYYSSLISASVRTMEDYKTESDVHLATFMRNILLAPSVPYMSELFSDVSSRLGQRNNWEGSIPNLVPTISKQVLFQEVMANNYRGSNAFNNYFNNSLAQEFQLSQFKVQQVLTQAASKHHASTHISSLETPAVRAHRNDNERFLSNVIYGKIGHSFALAKQNACSFMMQDDHFRAYLRHFLNLKVPDDPNLQMHDCERHGRLRKCSHKHSIAAGSCGRCIDKAHAGSDCPSVSGTRIATHDNIKHKLEEYARKAGFQSVSDEFAMSNLFESAAFERLSEDELLVMQMDTYAETAKHFSLLDTQLSAIDKMEPGLSKNQAIKEARLCTQAMISKAATAIRNKVNPTNA